MTPEIGLVSIVVASYNHAEYLEQRMNSLINQTYQNIEILVIDDCSTDNSVDVLRKYESHSKVKLIVREKNGGWVVVSNQGLDLATGEFVIFANCDDDCELTLIQKLVEAMRAHESAGISFSRSLMINEQSVLIGNDYTVREPAFKNKCRKDVLISAKEMRRFLMHSCVIPNLSAALFRADALTNVGNFSSNYKVCCDWDLFFRIAKQYDVTYVAAPLNKFRQHSTTIRSSTKQRDVYAEYFRLLLGQIKFLELGFYERSIIRTRVVVLWVRYLLLNPIIGFGHFNYHLQLINKLDPVAVLFLPVALGAVFIAATRKVLNK